MNLDLNTHELNRIAHRQARISKLMKKLEESKKALRATLFQYADKSYDGKEYLLPQTSIIVEERFFKMTGMTHEEFAKSRFPTWDVVYISPSFDVVTFVFKKKREYMPFGWEDEETKISRSVSEYTPEIDWYSLSALEPELFRTIGKEVTSYELDEEKLAEIVASDPSVKERLMIHTKHKEPTIRVLASTKNG
jgi:hypothetical protein